MANLRQIGALYPPKTFLGDRYVSECLFADSDCLDAGLSYQILS